MFARTVSLLALAGLLAFASGSVQAAPQVLAVLASQGGIPFACADGVCRAELTTYCLQKHREPPRFGEVYRPARPADFALLATDSAGVRHRLPTDGNVVFSGNRGFMSALALIPETAVRRHDIVSARIVVAESAALVPSPTAADDRPLTDDEIAAATGPLRAIGRGVVDDSETASTAQVLNRVSSRFAPVERFRPDDLAGLWQSVRTEISGELRRPEGLRAARTAYDRCTAVATADEPYRPKFDLRSGPIGAVEFASTMLRCLQRAHDGLIRDANQTYWNSLAGS